MKKPLTVVEEGQASLEDLTELVVKHRSEENEVLQKYHDLWYNSGHTWVFTQFLGVGLMKSPNDLWVYQDLITHHRPRTIIETGTYQGASALWMASITDLLGLDTKIYTIDIKNYRRCSHPKITFIEGDSTNPWIAAKLKKHIIYPLMVILDADHSEEHVRKELELYAPLTQPGNWLIVEDTNISWETDRGAAGALKDYLEAHPGEFRQDPLCERYLLTMNPGGWLQRVATREQAQTARRTGWAHYVR